jgi:hypothetical protein
MERLSDIMLRFNEGQKKFNKNLDFCLENGFSVKHSQVKSSIKQFSKILNSTALEFEKEINVFSDTFAIGINAFEKLTLIDFELTKNYENLQINFDRLTNFETSINFTLENMKSFRNTISAFPRNFPLLKTAKNNFLETLNLMISEFKEAQERNQNFYKALDRILN